MKNLIVDTILVTTAWCFSYVYSLALSIFSPLLFIGFFELLNETKDIINLIVSVLVLIKIIIDLKKLKK
jgi:hypothetical protein